MNDNGDQSAMESLTPDSYGQFLGDLKGRIQAAQLRHSSLGWQCDRVKYYIR